jgi:hypothetical protein
MINQLIVVNKSDTAQLKTTSANVSASNKLLKRKGVTRLMIRIPITENQISLNPKYFKRFSLLGGTVVWLFQKEWQSKNTNSFCKI